MLAAAVNETCFALGALRTATATGFILVLCFYRFIFFSAV